ncbi:hypothetical protein ACLSY0_10915 [Avibacterium avium]|uniref:hypothetical protein n=1 Tax=Avibacterium avium TaxID=751 RepID=UPI003BF881F7
MNNINYTKKLLEISKPISNKPDISLNIPQKIKMLFNEFNSYQSFEGALRICCWKEIGFRNILGWDDFMRRNIDKDTFFFADNIIGDGFCLKDDLFFKYDFETGDFEFMGEDLERFAKTLLLDYNYFTAYSLAKEWQIKNGVITSKEILLPKIPFILGGEYKHENLVKKPMKYGLEKKIEIKKTLENIPDGEKIIFEN